jgi:hypothetical protein
MLKKLIAVTFAMLMAASVNAATGTIEPVCDVTYTWESETMSGMDVGNGSATFFAQPMSEVDFNHTAQVKVLAAMAKEQDAKSKDAKAKKQANANEEPLYRVDVSEYRICGTAGKVKIADGSASIQGISYAGANRIGDEALKQAKVILDHHKARVAKGEKAAWDHSKSKKVVRDDVGNKKRD